MGRREHALHEPLRSLGRRKFLSRVVARQQRPTPSASRRPWLRLEDVPGLPDQLLQQIRPGPIVPLKLTETYGRLEVWVPGGLTPVLSFPPGSPASFVVPRLTRRSTLGETARLLADARCCGEKRALAETRRVFLDMVSKGLFAPTNVVG